MRADRREYQKTIVHRLGELAKDAGAGAVKEVSKKAAAEVVGTLLGAFFKGAAS